jgi:hypothetical protein
VGAPTEVARLKVTLRDIRPPIWRRMEVPLSFSFRDLSDAIVAAFAWSNSYLHEFEIGKRGEPGERCIGMPDEMDLGLRFFGPPIEDDLCSWSLSQTARRRARRSGCRRLRKRARIGRAATMVGPKTDCCG